MNVGVNNRASTINQIFVGVNNIARLVYQGGGGSGNFQLPTFTGSSSIFGDKTSGRIELYESGTLVLFPGTYDFFAVGGGSSGRSYVAGVGFGGGGGGGYTKTIKGIVVPDRIEYNITIGAGGTGRISTTAGQDFGAGGNSLATPTGTSSSIIEANGSTLPRSTNSWYGMDGGSGGGSGSRTPYTAGNGGSDGGNGVGGYTAGNGNGQGTTTRMFEAEDGTLFSGGGGGSGNGSTAASGGAGGGGSGGYAGVDGTAGTANTGGGGGGSHNPDHYGGSGGSGIVIVRWNNGGGNYSPTLADNTWAQIDAACKANDPILDSWKVGDEKDAVVNGETLTFVIVGKDHDDLADGSGKAKLSFMMKDLMTDRRRYHNISTFQANFSNSEIYSWLSTTVYNEVEEQLKNSIKAIRKVYNLNNNDNQHSTSTIECYLWLASQAEVFGEDYSFSGDSNAVCGTKYDYFVTSSERAKSLDNGNGSTSSWWLRDVATVRTSFSNVVVSLTGVGATMQQTSTNAGVCFGFCI